MAVRTRQRRGRRSARERSFGKSGSIRRENENRTQSRSRNASRIQKLGKEGKKRPAGATPNHLTLGGFWKLGTEAFCLTYTTLPWSIPARFTTSLRMDAERRERGWATYRDGRRESPCHRLRPMGAASCPFLKVRDVSQSYQSQTSRETGPGSYHPRRCEHAGFANTRDETSARSVAPRDGAFAKP